MGQMGTAYLQQPDEVKMRDCRPDQAFQVGIMGESGDGGEKATSYDDVIARIPPGHEPLTIGMGDRKNRFFHRIGDGDPSSIFTVANAPNVTPEAFSDIWATTCDAYGNFLLQVFMTVLEMAAIGVGAPKNLFTPLMRHGQHLVSIGGANLSKYTEPGVCINGFHDDLNFATLHTPAFPVIGKGRRAEACPGLFAYTRDLRRFPVVIPRGCVLLQVAQQWERVTGGHFLAGFHEVVTVPEHERFRLVAESAGMQAWRCATVVFGAAGSDQVLRPLGPFATREAEERYPGMFAALSTARKLVKIGMMPQRSWQESKNRRSRTSVAFTLVSPTCAADNPFGGRRVLFLFCFRSLLHLQRSNV
jgi:hypothetical protein